MHLDGRFVVRYRTSKRLKQALAGRTPQRWPDPEPQKAWRVAETLVGDLALYQQARAPQGITPSTPLDEVLAACRRSSGALWLQVEASYAERVPDRVRLEQDYLALAARSEWVIEDEERS